MSRAVRAEFAGATYHVISRGVARMTVFLGDQDRERFLTGIGRLVEDGDLRVYAFCLMPNHYHLLCSTPNGGLAAMMRHVNGDYATWFNRRHERVGHLWQGRYKAILVGDGTYLAECSRYIHLNPNRSKITRPAEKYRWSSYRSYVGGAATVPWVEAGPVLSGFDGDRSKYRKYVEAGKGERPVDPFERAVAGLALGGETFVAQIRRMLKGRSLSVEQPSLTRLRMEAMPGADAIECAVQSVFTGVSGRRMGRLILYALRHYSSLGPSAIARRYSRTPAAVTVATKAIEAEAGRDRRLAANLLRLKTEIGRITKVKD